MDEIYAWDEPYLFINFFIGAGDYIYSIGYSPFIQVAVVIRFTT
jgi:hypothetical protein